MKALLIGTTNPKVDNISAAQLYPFFDHRKQLRKKLGLEFTPIQVEKFSEIGEACKGANADVFFIRPSWRENSNEAEKVMATVRKEHPSQKLIFIDPFDQTSSRYFNLLPYVDRLLKYQRLKDISQYKQQFIGGTMLTDFLAKHWQSDLDGWHVGSKVPEGYEHRIDTGWNVGIDKRFKRAMYWPLLRYFRPKVKDIDVFCRLSFGSQHQLEWYGKYRMAAIEALKPLAADYNIIAHGEFEETKVISSRQYFNELKRSRIVFSPFGWGETTWRDYEAVCYGCLLIKPSVAHIDTKPNIYVAEETYVPVKWDFADLEEKCRYYLKHPDEAARIISNARRAYEAYFEQEEFVNTIEQAILAAS